MRWASAPSPRHQLVLFPTSLDESIPANHPLRQLDVLLDSIDWTSWENNYSNEHCGQPAIHPKFMSGCILYGLLKGIRSSRKLEDACCNRIDFMWFVENRKIDHATFAKFRQQHGDAIKDLFRQVNQAALKLRQSGFIELATDGTKIRANASRQKIYTEEFFSSRLDELDRKFSEAMKELEETDVIENPELATKEEIYRKLNSINREKQLCQNALKKTEELSQKRKRKAGAFAKPGKTSLTDSDSQLMPNKEGGFAPNYTPAVTVDKESGLILYADIVEGHAEADCVVPAMKEITANYCKKPVNVSMDSHVASGENLLQLEKDGINTFTKLRNQTSEIAKRPDLSEPVKKEDWDKLPKAGGKRPQLHRSAFIYDEKNDCYWCPAGKQLKPEKKNAKAWMGSNKSKSIALYICKSCSECEFKDTCMPRKKTKRGRTITRDEYENCREKVLQRMDTQEGKEIYKRRMHIVETIFGYLKGVLGIRQFLYRGMEKVKNEWSWMCLAYNVRKIIYSGQPV